jgi:Ca-activated chloride channel family protein
MTTPTNPQPINPASGDAAHWTLRQDRQLIRAGGGSERFVLAEIVAPTPVRDPARRRPPVNLAFVLDRSGSMAGHGKLDLAKQGVLEALDRLEPTDRFSVVTYDESIDVVVGSTPASGEARRLAVDALASVAPRGSTDLAGGWLRGAEQVASHLSADGVNRVLLLTDGLANVGIVDPAVLAAHAAQLRARGVATSTIGVGTDFDEVLLQQMADAGGGHFYFVGSLPEIRDHLTSEVGEALDVAVREAALTVTAPAGVSIWALTPYPTERHGARTVLQLGDLVTDQIVRLLIRVKFPGGQLGATAGMLFALSDKDGALTAAGGYDPAGVAWRFASDAESHAQPRDRVVDLAVAEVFAGRARQEAIALNRRGDWRGAQHALQAVAQRIGRYAGSDAQLLALAGELNFVEAPAMAAPMAEMNRKQMYFASSNLTRGRDAMGKSRKLPPKP